MSEPMLLLLLPGLGLIARDVKQGGDIASHLQAITRLVTACEREHHPALDGCAVYVAAVAWLRTRGEVAQ